MLLPSSIENCASSSIASTEKCVEFRFIRALRVNAFIRRHNVGRLIKWNAQRFGTHQQGSGFSIFIRTV